MSAVVSISMRRPYGLARVCRVWGVARAGVYRRRQVAEWRASTLMSGSINQVVRFWLLEWLDQVGTFSLLLSVRLSVVLLAS